MRILLLDIETAPNLAHVWGLWKQNVGLNQIINNGYTLCWAAKWYNEPKIYFDSIYESTEKKMIRGIHALIDEADAVVHYNGTTFDMPTLNKDFLLHGLRPPSPYKQIDLLLTARSQFRFPSNKLDYVAKTLGVGQKVKHAGFQLWLDCMNDCPKAWAVMKKYNKNDVTILEKVYDKLIPWIKSHPNHNLYADSDSPLCTNCGSNKLRNKGLAYTNAGIYRRFICKKCGTSVRGRSSQANTKSLVMKAN